MSGEKLNYKFVKTITNKWHNGAVNITKNEYYIFPYFVSYDYKYAFKCVYPIDGWVHTFVEVSENEFFMNSQLDLSIIDYIIELFQDTLDLIGMCDMNHPNMIMIIEILKQYNYGQKAIIKSDV